MSLVPASAIDFLEAQVEGGGYKELAEKLAALGVEDTERNIANRISRGGLLLCFLYSALRLLVQRNYGWSELGNTIGRGLSSSISFRSFTKSI